MSGRKPTSLRSRFRSRAVIDWIELRIFTRAPTQQQWIRRSLCGLTGTDDHHVRPIEPGGGGVCTQFSFRLYDEHANSYAELARLVAALDREVPLDGAAGVTGLEVALDFYGRGGDQMGGELEQMAHRLQASIGAYGSNPRQYDPATRRNVFLRSDDEPIDRLLNLRIGNKWDPVSWQVYYKRTDRGEFLPLHECRARAEFTLTGLALAERGINLLDDMASVRFESFADLLHFRHLKLKEDITAGTVPAVSFALCKWIGRTRGAVTLYPLGRLFFPRDSRTGKPRNRGVPVARQHSKHTAADAELNQIARDRLRDLTENFRRKLEAK